MCGQTYPRAMLLPASKCLVGSTTKTDIKEQSLASLFTHYDIKFNFKPVAGPYLKQLRESSVKQP